MVRLTVCRGCCCGTTKARPDVDHVEQLTKVAGLAAAGAATWRVSECLGPCEAANVVVVQPSPGARAAGAHAVWLGRVGDAQLDDVGRWVAGGGPGRSELPEGLRAHLIGRRPP